MYLHVIVSTSYVYIYIYKSKLFRVARRCHEIVSQVSVCKLSIYYIFPTNAASRVRYEMIDKKKLDGMLAAVTITICETASFFGISDTSRFLDCGVANISSLVH